MYIFSWSREAQTWYETLRLLRDNLSILNVFMGVFINKKYMEECQIYPLIPIPLKSNFLAPPTEDKLSQLNDFPCTDGHTGPFVASSMCSFIVPHNISPVFVDCVL